MPEAEAPVEAEEEVGILLPHRLLEALHVRGGEGVIPGRPVSVEAYSVPAEILCDAISSPIPTPAPRVDGGRGGVPAVGPELQAPAGSVWSAMSFSERGPKCPGRPGGCLGGRHRTTPGAASSDPIPWPVATCFP